MKVDRRAFCKAGGAILGTLSLSACEQAINEIDSRFGGDSDDLSERILVANTVQVDDDHHFLNRLSFGPTPASLAEIKDGGRESWLERQLRFDSIDDRMAQLRTRRFESRFASPGDCFDFRKEVLRADLVRHTLLKAIYSERQLLEVMVNFWSDHLNINIEKGNCVYYKTTDDLDVIRKHALGKFSDLIRASATGAAMLEYLDGKDNKIEKPGDAPNENYARELLELHTLGVDGGYTQKDVYEAARCLSGYRIREKFGKGKVFFDPACHDDGAKLVLGQVIPAGGGEADLDRLIQIVSRHPSTARYVCTKLIRHFVMDEPTDPLIDSLAKVFLAGEGNIEAVLRKLFNSKEFFENRGNKIKRPFRFLVSAVRAVGARTLAREPLYAYLSSMGQEPFQHPTPDGYPEETLPWLGSLLWRWNFAFGLAAGQIESVEVDLERLMTALGPEKNSGELLFAYLNGRKPTKEERLCLGRHKRDNAELFGLILSSPAFQRY
ncbi:MAG: DUF1800 domain-containing protein [Cyanobacteriota/Melainabacteria group bacterium]